MEHYSLLTTHCSRLLVFILLCITTCLESASLPNTSTSSESETDYLALLDLKKSITKDPLHVMSSWNESVNFCSWFGVTCNPSTKRVLTLMLRDQQLTGSIPPSIGNLTRLTSINLRNNSFQGELPQEIGRLQGLQNLSLYSNSFSGNIPNNISHCTQLVVLSLSFNHLTGSIPDQLSSLLSLHSLLLASNNLTGIIPPWVGNFSSLITLDLGTNKFQGSIPNELGRLTRLQIFSLSYNQLSGTVPSSIYNLSSINVFDIDSNSLHGELPPNLGITLPNLQTLSVSLTNFSGAVPASLANASRLVRLQLAFNRLTGSVPDLGRLQNLFIMNLVYNQLGTGKTGDLDFLSFLANCTSLTNLGLDHNHFGGRLPESIANLTNVRALTLGSNFIRGTIPTNIGNVGTLTLLGLEKNYLGGIVPDGIGKLQNLTELALNGNKFSGPIPSTIGNLTRLTLLSMENNRFEGSIPQSLGYCQNLIYLTLSNNHLTGTIPEELTTISSLSRILDMSSNSFTGPLPPEIGKLVHLVELYVSSNKLSGEIPNTLGSCVTLETLLLEGNEFEGAVPQSLKDLGNLKAVDFSGNNLSGEIPAYFAKFELLIYLNLSQNNFEGEVPKEGVFSNASRFSILGNHRLCGGIPELHLPPCSIQKHHSSKIAPKVVIPTACAVAFIIAMSCAILARSRVKNVRAARVTLRSSEDWKSGVSYLELLQSTGGFSMENLIGSGSFGAVYKGVVPGDGMVVAVKVLNLHQPGASKSFIDECYALRSIRHRNLLKIITACSSIDNHGNDFKSLVFEYLANGSLDSWLHAENDEQNSQINRLSLIQRLNIAIDVASALDYLHHGCETSIVHCDLKPNNILLDENMVGHVGDFGLARFLLKTSDNLSQSQALSDGLKGTIGYIPPEYGIGGQISILGDVYSYGILLLEMITGKRPTDDMFGEGLSIHQFTEMAMPDHAMDIVDPSLLIERDDDGDADTSRHRNEIQEGPSTSSQDGSAVQGGRFGECLVSVLQIGLSCSATTPGDRMPMDAVVNKMQKIRDSYLNLR